MSSIHSTGGVAGAKAADFERAERVSKAAPVQTDRGQTNEEQSSLNAKQLKQAEQKGEHLSVGQEHLVKAIEKAIEAVKGHLTSLDFSIHDQTKEIMVKVKDKETGEIIREIPPEKTLDLLAKLQEMAGLFVDERR
ncbi:flagellar protein FlaG [Paenibacillus thermoaerophilus]|uniref:Flagellar protein FlaG n=1 Tax=Paenibacillus thermoaerophilus TaxID=1215385 RepID=A0ABW2V969_9BACL|nr:flagellar protein FlaG [Paenibacillus thermoaerophilus]TMV09218.1 flagellar protein FlaG [Paenibacillus thermoaerophilus]